MRPSGKPGKPRFVFPETLLPQKIQYNAPSRKPGKIVRGPMVRQRLANQLVKLIAKWEMRP